MTDYADAHQRWPLAAFNITDTELTGIQTHRTELNMSVR